MKIVYLTSSQLSQFKCPASLVVVAMPYTQAEMAQPSAELMSSRAGVDGLIVCVLDEERRGFVELANNIFQVTQSPYFAYVAQDAYPGRQWLSRALTALGEDKSLLGFNDGKWAGALAAFGLVRRSWALQNYQGNLFYEGYSQHYEDVELTLLAMQENVYAYDPNSVLIEVDWGKDRRPVHQADKVLFKQRLQKKLDGRLTSPHLLQLFA
jgi:hypothetical protein